MAFKINLSEKTGKTFKLEADAPALMGKELHDKVQGKDISPDLEGYEFKITGTSDRTGTTSMKEVEGIGSKKVLLTRGKGMHIKPKGEKKKGQKIAGLRLRKRIRGTTIAEDISQINLKVTKDGAKKLDEIFPDQCQPKVKENRKAKRLAKANEPAPEAPKEAEPVTEVEAPKEEVKKEAAPVEEKAEKVEEPKKE